MQRKSLSWKRLSSDSVTTRIRKDLDHDNISPYLAISPGVSRKNQNVQIVESTNGTEVVHHHDKLSMESLKKKRKKRKTKSPYPHTLEPRDSLLFDVAAQIKDKDFMQILQVPNLQGLVNLGFLILVSGTLQLIGHNYIKHGFLVDVGVLTCLVEDIAVAVFLWMGLTAFAINTYLLQKRLVEKEIVRSTALILHIASLVLIYAVPIAIIFWLRLAPIVSGGLALCICVLSMKMHSYFATNLLLEQSGQDSRAELKRSRSDEEYDDSDEEHKLLEYPHNVTLSNYLYFLFVPTLVYEMNYPRKKHRRWFYAAKEFMQCLGCFGIMYIMLIQFILPVVQEQRNLMAYDLVRLSIPSIILWLLGFYAIFHCFLNFMSEILMYADRQFYLDWWNAPTLDIFWRKWNLLVHEWLHRHIYWESIRSGNPKKRAMVFTFLFSAFMHELIFWVMLKVIRPWFFLGMFGQIPLILLSKWINDKLSPENARRWGNIFVWCSLFVGQPLLEILYIREWFWKHSDFFCVEKPNIFLTLESLKWW